MTNYVIFGASRGLGAAFSAGLPVSGDTIWLTSRTQPSTLKRDDGVNRFWVQADLADPPRAAQIIRDAVGEQPVDLLLYNAGIWEDTAFSRGYDFTQIRPDETAQIIAVNLTSAILSVQTLTPNLRRAAHAKVILIGSTSGLENIRTPEVAYNASKFGMRGAAHALRENLRPDRIPVTIINPGDLAAEHPYDAGMESAIKAYNGTRIPPHDMIALVKCIMTLSPASCIKEIDMPAITDENA